MNQNREPLVTVMMTSYNTEKYIGRAVNSILNQTYSNYEFLILDDCSTDNTFDILARLAKKDERILLSRNEVNLGPGASSNILIRQSKGKYIVRMDSDDESYLDRIRKQVQFMEANKDVVVSGGSMHICNEKMQVMGIRDYPQTDEDIRKCILRFNPIPHPASIWKRDVLFRTDFYSETSRISEDYKLVLQAGSHGKLANIKDVLIKFRVSSTSESNSKMKKQQLETIRISRYATRTLGYKYSFMDVLWIALLYGTMYIIPSNLKRSLFNIMVMKRDKV
ncbi:glycosyltransferase family 2 protein [Candidatus Dojkabacteria bacterium]|uniref:Glycosyltransferase family 2 protein n=1 Tax=Candidatus Dojkabacteria bacterium TaxID=2099670 RepID=A0A955RH66_9BACT|nr:glycosyltransferase family 2 protein [Candidatus Dojkabacteria bacterium]